MILEVRVAQSVERGTFNPKVQGSSPCPGDCLLPENVLIIHSSTKITTFSGNMMKTWILKDFLTLKTMVAFI